MKLTIALTGASGSIAARELLRACARDVRVERVDFIPSDASLRVLGDEFQPVPRSEALRSLLADATPGKFRQHTESDVGAGPASGSYPCDAMIVLPCSMRTLAAIAQGLSANLIERAADVTLKERRPLLLCVRETPLNLIQLRNMVAVTEAGATVFPLMPAFYAGLQTVEDAARQFAFRILAHFGLPQPEGYRWRDD